MLHSGIDKHKDNCFIVTVNDEGKVLKEARVKNSVATLTAYFTSFGKEPHRAVVESTTGWYWLDDLLTSLGIELILAHAKYLRAIAYVKVKTDQMDAHTLAHLLRLGYIPAAHKISRALRDTRDLCRARLRLVYKRTGCYNSIHRLGEKYNCLSPSREFRYKIFRRLSADLRAAFQHSAGVPLVTLANGPGNSDRLYNLMVTWEAIDAGDMAGEFAEEALAINPFSSAALNNREHIWMTAGNPLQPYIIIARPYSSAEHTPPWPGTTQA